MSMPNVSAPLTVNRSYSGEQEVLLFPNFEAIENDREQLANTKGLTDCLYFQRPLEKGETQCDTSQLDGLGSQPGSRTDYGTKLTEYAAICSILDGLSSSNEKWRNLANQYANHLRQRLSEKKENYPLLPHMVCYCKNRLAPILDDGYTQSGNLTCLKLEKLFAPIPSILLEVTKDYGMCLLELQVQKINRRRGTFRRNDLKRAIERTLMSRSTDFSGTKNGKTEKNVGKLSMKDVRKLSYEYTETSYLANQPIGPGKNTRNHMLENVLQQHDTGGLEFDVKGLRTYPDKSRTMKDVISTEERQPGGWNTRKRPLDNGQDLLPNTRQRSNSTQVEQNQLTGMEESFLQGKQTRPFNKNKPQHDNSSVEDNTRD